jgi:hypothetical protein
MAIKKRFTRKSVAKYTKSRGYILPHGYEVKHVVVKKKPSKRRK